MASSAGTLVLLRGHNKSQMIKKQTKKKKRLHVAALNRRCLFQTHLSLASDASERIKSPLVSFRPMKRRFKTLCGFHGDFLAIVLFSRGGFLVAVMSPRKESDSLHGVYVRLWPFVVIGAIVTARQTHTRTRVCTH